MSGQISITLNGRPALLPAGSTVDVLLDAAGLPSQRRRGIAIAVNHAVVPRSLWSTTTVNDGDSAEIVTAVQGG